VVQNIDDLVESVRLGYSFVGPTVDLGALVVDGEVHSDVSVRIPLGLLNRHGLIAGATGTGKTKTLQLLAEQLSAHASDTPFGPWAAAAWPKLSTCVLEVGQGAGNPEAATV
jgi:DNA helicase HerA-like ATPase